MSAPAPKHKTAPYFMRRLRDDLRDRVRMVATLRGDSMEHVMNLAIEAGLAELERGTVLAGKRKKVQA